MNGDEAKAIIREVLSDDEIKGILIKEYLAKGLYFKVNLTRKTIASVLPIFPTCSWEQIAHTRYGFMISYTSVADFYGYIAYMQQFKRDKLQLNWKNSKRKQINLGPIEFCAGTHTAIPYFRVKKHIISSYFSLTWAHHHWPDIDQGLLLAETAIQFLNIPSLKKRLRSEIELDHRSKCGSYEYLYPYSALLSCASATMA